MRVTFNIEMKTDVPAHDMERRKAFIDLFIHTSRRLYTQAAMLSKGVSPDIKVTSLDNENGEEQYPLFQEEENSNG